MLNNWLFDASKDIIVLSLHMVKLDQEKLTPWEHLAHQQAYLPIIRAWFLKLSTIFLMKSLNDMKHKKYNSKRAILNFIMNKLSTFLILISSQTPCQLEKSEMVRYRFLIWQRKALLIPRICLTLSKKEGFIEQQPRQIWTCIVLGLMPFIRSISK